MSGLLDFSKEDQREGFYFTVLRPGPFERRTTRVRIVPPELVDPQSIVAKSFTFDFPDGPTEGQRIVSVTEAHTGRDSREKTPFGELQPVARLAVKGAINPEQGLSVLVSWPVGFVFAEGIVKPTDKELVARANN